VKQVITGEAGNEKYSNFLKPILYFCRKHNKNKAYYKPGFAADCHNFM